LIALTLRKVTSGVKQRVR